MPELPEVETTARGVAPLIVGQRICQCIIRDGRLRWPVPNALPALLAGQTILAVRRRAKYLLIETGAGHVLIHLGMSGSLRVLGCDTPPGPHDHVDWVLDNNTVLRLRDPRRFGCVLWAGHTPDAHPLLRALGPEPLARAFNGEFLYQIGRKRHSAVKMLLMNSHVVVGVGNIYASESLFAAGIHPARAAGRISLARYGDLAKAVKITLRRAIKAGGTTLRDFTRADGKPGYFRYKLKVYDRTGEPCVNCGAPIQERRIAQRSSFLCGRCQR